MLNRRVLFSSPRTPYDGFRHRASTFWRPPASDSTRNRNLDTTFPSPATPATSRQLPSPGHRSRPTSLVPCRTLPQARSVSAHLLGLPFGAGEALMLQPVACFQIQQPQQPQEPQLHVGTLVPSPQRCNSLTAREFTQHCARYSFTPRPGAPLTEPQNGSTIQNRYASSGSLFREPLGTITIMPRTALSVKRKVGFFAYFAEFIFPLFAECYWVTLADGV